MRVACYEIGGPHPVFAGEVTVADEDVQPAVEGYWAEPGRFGGSLLILG